MTALNFNPSNAAGPSWHWDQRLRKLWAVSLFALSLLYDFTTSAQTSKENQLKAVFLFRLAQFVEWPASAFETNESPIIIGILGEDPFGQALDLVVRDETAHNRPLGIRQFKRVEDVTACHILFISRSESGHIETILRTLQGRSILTVSDLEESFLKKGGMIRFVTEQNKVNIQIHPEVAKEAGLIISSRLLRVADIFPRR